MASRLHEAASSFHAAERTPSWRRTVVIQIALCLAFYAAFNIGTPQGGSRAGVRTRREPMDLYFISVRGGARPPREQSQLLLQMEKTAKVNNVKFVLDIVEPGEEDPFLNNATSHFPSEIPWLATHGQGSGNFVKRIKLPRGEALDIISFYTGPAQELMEHDISSKNRSNHLNWIQETLESTDSNWRVVVGFDPLVVCEEKHASVNIKFHKPLHDIFLEHDVVAYISKQSCAGYYYHREGILYIGIPGPADNAAREFSVNANPDVISQIHKGFLLHRVSPVEIESSFMDHTGKIVLRSVIQRRGRGVF